VMLDAPYYEMITNGGKTRVGVTDTGDSNVISSNRPLLRWARELDRLAVSSPTKTR